MPKDTMDLEKLQRFDHDTLIRLEVLVKNVSDDIKEMKDGTARQLANLELRLKVVESVHEATKPEQTLNEFRIVQRDFRDFVVQAQTARYFAGLLGGLLASVLTLFLNYVLKNIGLL